MKMLSRDAAIRAWIQTHRPDMDIADFDAIMAMENSSDPMARGLLFLSIVAFEAGRQFQQEHPGMELNAPWLYEEVEVEPAQPKREEFDNTPHIAAKGLEKALANQRD